MTLDTSVPGFPERDDWPMPPQPPFRLRDFGAYRDPSPWCTVIVILEDSAGNVYPFFFDRFLRRLCYGSMDNADNAALIRKGSRLEIEAFSAIESAVAAFVPEDHLDPLEIEYVIDRLAYVQGRRSDS